VLNLYEQFNKIGDELFMNNKIEPLETIKKIYEGHIQFDDKPFVNKECDKLYMEIEDIRKKPKSVSYEVLFKKYDRLIRLLEVECFAKGARFMFDLIAELKPALNE